VEARQQHNNAVPDPPKTQVEAIHLMLDITAGPTFMEKPPGFMVGRAVGVKLISIFF
jgi:hypothetical protein